MGGDWGPEGNFESGTLLAEGTNIPLAPLGAFTFANNQDMRTFAGYYLWQEATTTGAAAYNPIRANMQWYAHDDPAPNVNSMVYREDYEWWAATAAPSANDEAVFSGFMGSQDHCHGQSLTLSYSNQGISAVTLSYRLYGTTRPLPQAYQSFSAYDDVLYENNNLPIVAGGAHGMALPMFYGRLGIHRENVGGGAVTDFYIRWGSNPNVFNYSSLASNATGNPVNFEIIAPRRPMQIVVQNLGLGTTNRIVVTTERKKK